MKKIKYRRYSDYEKSESTIEFLNLKIIVKTEEEKNEIIKASKYLHDFIVKKKRKNYKKKKNKYKYICLDSDIMSINYLMHIYTTTDVIEIKQDEKFL